MSRLTARGATLAAIAVLLCSTRLAADGGIVLLSEVSGPYRVTIFTHPAPLRVGRADLSILVQDAQNGTTIRDTRITLQLWPPDRPDQGVSYRASTEAATNRLYQAAIISFPTLGRWRASADIHGEQGNARVSCVLNVQEPAPRWVQLSPWLAWPAAVMALFALREFFAQAATGRRMPRAMPRAERRTHGDFQ